MQRRDFVRKATLGAAAGVTLAGCGGGAPGEGGAPAVQTQRTIRWRLVSSFSRSLDTIYGAAEVLAERVSALTDGRFQIRPYPGGELVPAFGVLDAVQSGTVQMGHTASYYYVGKNPAFAFDTCVPFGLTSRQQTAWMYHGGGLELMRALFADFGIRPFPGGNTGAQMGGWFRREVPSLSDLRGIKMRIPGLGGRVMDALGVTPQQISSSEIYPALERGAIDATEWVGPYDDEKLGFNQIARFYYYPGWWEPGPQLTFYVNQREWDRLPAAYQEALTVAAAEAHVGMQAKYDAQNPPALQRLVDAGTELRRFADDILTAAAEQTTAILEEQAADPTYNRIYTAFKDWKQRSFRWFGLAEQAYAHFAFGT
ncbi:MAG: ABC transporter substrate-binding protein [Bacteroidetes bacterium]|nr:MAG: ABC transporter substrate-binding protein [Bacteroidota bacterium]